MPSTERSAAPRRPSIPMPSSRVPDPHPDYPAPSPAPGLVITYNGGSPGDSPLNGAHPATAPANNNNAGKPNAAATNASASHAANRSPSPLVRPAASPLLLAGSPALGPPASATPSPAPLTTTVSSARGGGARSVPPVLSSPHSSLPETEDAASDVDQAKKPSKKKKKVDEKKRRKAGVPVDADLTQLRVVKRGWLFKKADYVRNWRKRYFILTCGPPRLIYFKEECTLADPPRSIIPLNNALIGEVEMKKDAFYAFSIRTPAPRKALYSLSAKSPLEADQWVRALRKSVQGGETGIDVPLMDPNSASSAAPANGSGANGGGPGTPEQKILGKSPFMDYPELDDGSHHLLKDEDVDLEEHAFGLEHDQHAGTLGTNTPLIGSAVTRNNVLLNGLGNGSGKREQKIAIGSMDAVGPARRLVRGPSTGAFPQTVRAYPPSRYLRDYRKRIAEKRKQQEEKKAAMMRGGAGPTQVTPLKRRRSSLRMGGGAGADGNREDEDWGGVQNPDRLAMIIQPMNQLLDQAVNTSSWRLDSVESSVRVTSRVKPGVVPDDPNVRAAMHLDLTSGLKKQSNTKKDDVVVFKGACTINAPASVVFDVLMDLETRGRWDPCYDSVALLETLDVRGAGTQTCNMDQQIRSARLNARVSFSGPDSSPAGATADHRRDEKEDDDESGSDDDEDDSKLTAPSRALQVTTAVPPLSALSKKVAGSPATGADEPTTWVDEMGTEVLRMHCRFPSASAMSASSSLSRAGTITSAGASSSSSSSSSSSFLTLCMSAARGLCKTALQAALLNPALNGPLTREICLLRHWQCMLSATPVPPAAPVHTRHVVNVTSTSSPAPVDAAPAAAQQWRLQCQYAISERSVEHARQSGVRTNYYSSSSSLQQASETVPQAFVRGGGWLVTAMSKYGGAGSGKAHGTQGSHANALRSLSGDDTTCVVEYVFDLRLGGWEALWWDVQWQRELVRRVLITRLAGLREYIHQQVMPSPHLSGPALLQHQLPLSSASITSLNSLVVHVPASQMAPDVFALPLPEYEMVARRPAVLSTSAGSLASATSTAELTTQRELENVEDEYYQQPYEEEYHAPEEEEEDECESPHPRSRSDSVSSSAHPADMFPNISVDPLLVPDDPNDGLDVIGVKGIVRNEAGGLKFVDKDELERQKGVINHMVRTMGRNLLAGKSVINISLPVRVFEPRSFLERMTDHWCYAPIYLTLAALSRDPVERLKYCVAFLVSGLHRGCKQFKPFNPILGETLQSHYRDGTNVFCEQISHHPPVSAFQVVGPQEIFSYWGHHEYAASMRSNGIIGQQLGPNYICFKDGTEITFNMPHVLVRGFIWGDRVMTWVNNVQFVDLKNNLGCELLLNPDKKTGFGSFMSSAKTPSDTLRGEIYCMDENSETGKRTLSTIEGSWIGNLTFDGKEYWRIRQYKPLDLIPASDQEVLPSDCRFREDLIYLKAGDEDKSQMFKETLENKQRYDRALRQKLGPKSKSKH